MSNQQDTEPIPSNERIIEEITGELNKQAISNENTPLESNARPISELESAETSILEDFDKSDSEDEPQEKTNPLNDFIDEEELKIVNATLTSDQKAERLEKALELKKLGNALHKDGKYLESVENYTEALRLCPLENTSDRAVFYCNRGASKLQLDYKKSAIEDVSKAIELNSNYVRAYLRRAKLYEDTDKLDESLEDYKKVLELDPGNPEAVKATVRLPPKINERNEKLKTEMMGKLKDLGNMFLRPFGLSTENFQMQQDPNSGGYSINFKQ